MTFEVQKEVAHIFVLKRNYVNSITIAKAYAKQQKYQNNINVKIFITL